MRIRNKPQYRKLLSNTITSDVKADFKAITSCSRIYFEKIGGLLQFIERRMFLLQLTDDEFRSLIDPIEESEVKRFIINMEYQKMDFREDSIKEENTRRCEVETCRIQNVNSERRKRLNPILANLSEQQTISQKNKENGAAKATVWESSTNV